jgi:tRNA A-37 threonylcarbamoyl transferase component Bud32
VEQPSKIGRYEIIERVGRGGMGVLYRGRDTVLEREVAIKVMSADFLSDEQARPRFYREARAAAKLQHRNIVTVFEFAEEGDTPFIVMEFLRGQSLADCVKKGTFLGLDRKLDIVGQLCTGLHFAHEQGVVHRDVKPGNIWLLEDGGVKLLDFGIAKIGGSTMTQAGDVMGSANYMSPEQVAGKAVDGRADVFAAGVVLYELLSGQRPFAADSPTATIMKIMDEAPTPLEALVPDLPRPLVAAVSRALEKDPDKRYALAGDLGAELRLVRLSLQKTGDTILGDLEMGETMYAPLPAAERTAAQVAAPSRVTAKSIAAEFDKTPRPAPARASSKRSVSPIWIAAAAVAVLAIGGGVAILELRGAADKSAQAADEAQPTSPLSAPAEPSERARPAAAPSTAAPSAAVPSTDAKPAALPASLEITSQPAGASINIDGRDTGLVTPAHLPIGTPAPQRLRLAKQGYQTFETGLTDSLMRKGVASFQLSAQERQVVVEFSGHYAFQVLDGRKVISDAKESHTVKVGAPRTLRLVAPEYLLDQPVKVEAGTGGQAISAPELGQLTLRVARETCSVSINGHDLGFPPIANQTIASGSYTVELKCPDGRNQKSQVTVPPGGNLVEVIR